MDVWGLRELIWGIWVKNQSIKYAGFRIKRAGWLKKVSKIEQKLQKIGHKCALFEQK
ncbi:MAG: hypothetical protein ACYS30_21465 [Planctomycetota bacterium]|jgi:hypothetical protein